MFRLWAYLMKLFQKRVVRTKLDIYVLVIVHEYVSFVKF
jgi:hypothetical protein